MMPLPRHIARLAFVRTGDPLRPYECHLPPAGGGMRRVLLVIRTTTYPLERHCCYMRRMQEEGPYTFPHMDFAPAPPGIRVGPWPGWRGIPPFPAVSVRWDGGEIEATVHFWGDEIECRHVRAVAWIPPDCSGALYCHAGDERLEPASLDLYQDEPIASAPRPVSLRAELTGVHPRLLVTPASLGDLAAQVAGARRTEWERLCALIDGPQLPPEITPESKTVPGPERLRPEDRALISAFVALLDPSPARVEQARAAYRAFVQETRRPDYAPLGIDTQAGETLFLLVVCFDWLHARLSETERSDVRAWLWTLAARVRAYLPPDRRDFAQAHYLGCALGLLAFSFAFWETHPDARSWAAEFRGTLETVLGMLPADGFHPHGANLWIYEYGFLLRWIELFCVCAGEDLWSSPHWAQASAFRAAALSGDGRLGITFGDPQFRVGGDSWCHDLIAARTGSAAARRTADRLREVSHEGVDFRHVPPRRRVYELLFRDTTEGAERGPSAEKLTPAVHVFADGGQVFARGTGDGGSVFTFRAGPPLGTQRYAGGERGGYGHADPCSGSFLWLRRNVLCIAGPGPTYRRDSSLQNMITFGGRGQVGDGTVWLPDFFPPGVLCPTPSIAVHDRSLSLDVDTARSYLPHLRVSQCHRALWVDPDCAVVGVDTVSCEIPAAIEWNLHSRGEFVQSDGADRLTWQIRCGEASLVLHLLLPASGATSSGWTPIVPAYPHDGTRDRFFRWQIHGTAARFVWSLSADPMSGRPALSGDDSSYTIRLSRGTVLRYDGGRLLPVEGPC